MTTPTATPGTVIDIKLSELALNHISQEKNLGATLNSLFEKQKSFLGPDGASGTVASGGSLSVAPPNGQTLRFIGTRDESPGAASAGGKLGGIYATSVTTSEPNGSSSATQGKMVFMYDLNGKNINVYSTNSKISGYQFNTLNASENPALGKTSTSYSGLLDSFGDAVFDIQHLSAFLSGKITNLNFSASNTVRSTSLKGDLNIVVSNEISVPITPTTQELPPTYVVNTKVSGSVDSYNASYYDGSYLKMKAASGVATTEQTTILGLLDDASLWTGDDDLRIELPKFVQNTWNINTAGGNDKITAKGGGGELIIDTGAGDDQITLLDNSPLVRGGDGIDTLRAEFASDDMWHYPDIENFIFTGRTATEIQGNALDNELTGGNLADTIRGDLGNDILHGLNGNDLLDGGIGNDQMWGGAGNDTYIVDTTEDLVNEARSTSNPADSGGKDTVISSINYTLGAYLENLQLAGAENISGVGNALANSLVGNDGNNFLRGEGGNDTLIGKGGDDVINGGAGNDTLEGSEGNDTLDGGVGADTMRGGAGDDSYIVDNVADRIFETISATDKSDAGGVDTVFSSISFSLGDNFENLFLFGSANLNATGNAAANIISGNSGDNIINGKGGIDKLDGADGSDIYLIGSPAEHTEAEISDTGSGGIDEVRFSPTPPIPAIPGAGTPPPKLTLFAGDTGIERVSISTGTGKLAVTSGKLAADIDASAVQNGLTLIGNAGSNHLIGTEFDDTLAGNGGNDLLTGGLGSDKFIFNMAPNAKTDVDTISDFASGSDQLVFVRSKFSGLATGDTLQESAFYAADGATKAHDADDRFIYDSANGNLYFDKDGTGTSAAVLIGLLNGHPTLAATDFKIVDIF